MNRRSFLAGLLALTGPVATTRAGPHRAARTLADLREFCRLLGVELQLDDSGLVRKCMARRGCRED